MRSTVLRRILTVAFVIALLVALQRSARRAHAVWLITQPGRQPIERSCQAEPGNALCFAVLAAAVELQGESPDVWLHRAIGLAPRKARYLVDAATSAEMSGGPATALRLLEQAERFNKMWLPRWALASFHFRQGNREESLRWARLALERSYGDRAAVFDLAARAGAGPEVITGSLLPDGPEFPAAYLNYVLKDPARPGLAEAALAAARQAENAPPTLRAQLLEACNRLMLTGNFASAAELWDQLARHKAVPYPPATAHHAGINGDFRHKPVAGGWDWWMPVVEGVESSWRQEPGEVRFTLSGQQAESCELLAQWLWLRAGATYELSIESRGGGPGLGWRLHHPDGGAAGVIQTVPGEDWNEHKLTIAAAPEARAVRMVLASTRVAGHPRPQGEYRVRRVSCARR